MTSMSSQPPMLTKSPSRVQKLSGVQSFIFVSFDLSDITTSVTTSATKAVVVAPSIGAAAPVLNAVATVAPAPAAIEVIPAFL